MPRPAGRSGCDSTSGTVQPRSGQSTIFKNASLKESDFSECDLTGSIFEKCDLEGALFENTNLEKADFRTSFNYSIDPEINRIRKAKFSISEISGLLNKYDIEIDRID
jgi:uncharacterized protein YjbI with pentapeptide repeats